MNPGELDRRVVLYQEGPVAENPVNNEPEHTDILYSEVWAKYEPASESETIIDDFDQLRTFAKFTIRYIQTINETWKLKYNNKWYGINSITPIGRENILELQCESSQQTNFKT